ncbi:ferritin-like domain-containing protein [Ideonella sp. A 288]|uniref:ferritin-like domain-containing protein n=1 Tax=Ideonella sp. A 288 TaxID=1962181 RepID=UPI000B4C080C|nr:ferritin-like domain-containing protein [Ideonella sp. A 288]
MSTMRRYALPVDQTGWRFQGQTETGFSWEYDEPRDRLLRLYDKAKRDQWDQATRIDWSTDLDPENPMQLDDRMISIHGTELWNKLDNKQKAHVRRHAQAWNVSQLMHGEQGALIATARIVQMAPDMDAKFYAATQVMDEARHVESYSRLLHEKFELAYPMTTPLKTLLEQGLSDSRWDFVYLCMQVLIEGLALAAFQRLRDYSKNPLAVAVNAYVMQDEARHVAFGRIALQDFYKELTDHERAEREEFLVEGCYLMRDRFDAREMWEHLGFPVAECVEAAMISENQRIFRAQLFSRIVPTVKDIGLWGPKVRAAYQDMGVMQFADTDLGAKLQADEDWAKDLDARRALNAHQAADAASA